LNAPGHLSGEIPYVELQVATNFSFLRGASHPDEVFARAKALGYTALGITDFDSVAGMVRAHVAAAETGLRLIPGCRVTLTDESVILAYPTDRGAWARLCRLLTLGQARGDRQGSRLGWQDLATLGAGLIFILQPQPGDTGLEARLVRLKDTIERIRTGPEHANARGHATACLGLTRHFRHGDIARLRDEEALAARHDIPTVVIGDVLYRDASRSVLQDVVTAIRTGRTMDTLGDAREYARDRHLRAPEDMRHLYTGFEAALARSSAIAESCRFSIDDLRYQYPDESEGFGETPHETLSRLVTASLPDRYPRGAPENVRRQIAHELSLIDALDYAPYFLTVNTIVRQARSLGIVCQGRGSAANSAICYVLGITAIDPVQSGLLFERFVSAERREPPDIDVDFESDRREEIIQWIYERYGRSHAALCATVMRYQPKGALREVGKVMGVPQETLALLSKHLASTLDDPDILHARAGYRGLDLTEPRLAMTLTHATQLLTMPRQLGTHPGGFVLTRDRLDELVPVQPAAMEDRQIIVWDKNDIDALRFMKVDVLGLGMLGCLKRCFEFLAAHHHLVLDIASIPPEDPATYAMIRKADTLGTFQIESRAQMSMLPRLRPTTFYDLVVQVAIVRPGPIQGQMVHPYLRRRDGLEQPDCPTPELQAILGKTLGVPLFQEQAMQVAIHCAGFTPGEADQLRRSMATFKFTGGVSHFRDKLINGMVARGYAPDFAARSFSQLEGFGSYGFPESHAASFALVAYASSYLKCHHPDAFCAALLNAQPIGFYAPAQIVRDARDHGVDVRAIDINRSRWDCSLEGRPGAVRFTVRLGMRMVKGLANADAARIVAHRMPAYESVEDVWRRADVPVAALERLAEADAFRSLGLDRRAALWAIKGLAPTALPLFAAAGRFANRIEPECNEPGIVLDAMTEGADVAEDYNAAGLTLRAHPLSFLRGELQGRDMIRCADLASIRDGRQVRLAGLVLMRQRPGTAKGVMFMTIEDETGVANLIFWKDRIEAQRPIVIGAMIGVTGMLQREGEITHIIARTVEDLTPLLRRVGADARDGNAPTTSIAVRSRDFR